ncbi:MAG TPA: TolC family protein, partial [Sphingobacterium sp.]|nr:TolC family protein [Sphingobacterium sp.]
MKRSKIVAILVAGLFSGSLAKAQEVLTLQQAIKYALENKAEAKKSKLDIENAQNKIDEARSNALPQINFSGGATYNAKVQKSALDIGAFGGMMGGGGSSESTLDGNLSGVITDDNGNPIGNVSGTVTGDVTPKPVIPVPGDAGSDGGLVLVGFGTPWSSTNVISLNQQIFNQTGFTGLKAAKTTREFYQLNNELTEEQLIEKVANAYYQVFQTQQNLETIQTNLDNTIKTRDIIKGLYEAGLQRKIDLDRLNVAVNNIESQKQQLVNAVALQENALKFVVGMDISRDIELPTETFDVELSKLYETADLDSRAEIRLLNKQSELLELNKQAIKSQYYPTVSLNANYGFLGFSNDFFLFKPKSSVWADFSTIGLTINVPIFNGHATRSRVRQAQIDLDKLKVDITDAKLGLHLANENAKAQIKNNILVINTNKENVQLAKEVLDNTQNNYRNGLATLTDL